LNLRLPNHLQCKTCTAFFNNLVFKPKQKRGTSANRICERPWHFSNSTSRMNVKRLSYQGVIAFLSKEGINDETSDEATDTEEEATDALATMSNHHGTEEENNNDVIVAAVNDEDGMESTQLVGTSSTCPMTPATIVLPVTISPPPTTTATATTTRTPASTSTTETATSTTSNTTSTTSIDDPCPPPQQQEQEAYKRPRKPYTRGFGPQTTVDGKHTVQDVPNHYSLIYGSTLAELQQDAKSYHKLKSALLGQDKCNWNPLARRHLAAGMMQIPYASFTGVEQLIPCVLAAIFAAADIKVNPELLSKNCPSENLLKEIVRDGAVDCLLWLMDELKGAHAVFLACDKGNRKGVDHLAKVLSWWDETERCVRSVCLDIDGSGGSSENVGDAIDHSLKKLLDAVEKLAGQSHDGGGGGVGDSLMDGLIARNRTRLHGYYATFCTLHALQLGLSRGFEAAFGGGGIGLRTLLQLVHSFSDLQNCLTHKERHAMWDLANELDADYDGLPPNSIQEAVLTRWWSVTAAARAALKNWKQWGKFADDIANSTKTDTKTGKIARDLIGLMKEPKLYSDLLFIVAFSETFFVEHFEWLQDHDTHAKDFGYRSRDMPVRSFLIIKEMEKLKLEWRTRSEFSKFKAHVDTVLNHEPSAASQAKKDDPLRRLTWTKPQFYKSYDAFFDAAIASYKKHFSRWKEPGLLSYAFAGDSEPAHALAKWIVDSTIPHPSESYKSETHGNRTINLRDFVLFCTEKTTTDEFCCTREELEQTTLVQRNMFAIGKLAASSLPVVDLWNTNDQVLTELRIYCERNVLPHASSTHRVEACIREASHCSSTGRSEEDRSAFALQRSVANTAVNIQAKKEAASRELRGNQHISSGKVGERKHISQTSKRKHNSNEDGDEQASAKRKIRVRGAPRATILLENTTTRHDMLQEVPIERRKEVATRMREGYSEKRTQEKVEEFNTKRAKQRNTNAIEQRQGVHIPANLAGRHTYYSFRRVAAILEVRLELQERGFQAEDLAKLGIIRLITLLKDNCQGLRADGDLVSLITDATEPLADQQVDGDDKTFLPRTSMVPRS
jgi:hypothetical protein